MAVEAITSRKNNDVRLMRALFRDVNERRETSLFAVEGDHLCGELSDHVDSVDLFLYTERAAQKYPETLKKVLAKSLRAFVITEELSEYISDTKSPQGLFAAAGMFCREMSENPRKAVILDRVQDPGNVGTIIRAAEAFGIDSVMLYGGCADAFSPKAVRASMGSVFRVNIKLGSYPEEVRLVYPSFKIYAAMLDGSANRLGKVIFPEKTAIVIGSEGSGISPEISAICDEKIYIPISGAESLNAAMAAAVIMWEMVRGK